MSLNPYLREDSGHLPLSVNDNCGADRSGDHFSIHVFLTPRPIFFVDFMVRVGEEPEGQVILLRPFFLCGWSVAAHAYDFNIFFVELFYCVPKLGRLSRSSAGVGLWVEKKNHTFACKVF